MDFKFDWCLSHLQGVFHFDWPSIKYQTIFFFFHHQQLRNKDEIAEQRTEHTLIGVPRHRYGFRMVCNHDSISPQNGIIFQSDRFWVNHMVLDFWVEIDFYCSKFWKRVVVKNPWNWPSWELRCHAWAPHHMWGFWKLHFWLIGSHNSSSRPLCSFSLASSFRVLAKSTESSSSISPQQHRILPLLHRASVFGEL